MIPARLGYRHIYSMWPNLIQSLLQITDTVDYALITWWLSLYREMSGERVPTSWSDVQFSGNGSHPDVHVHSHHPPPPPSYQTAAYLFKTTSLTRCGGAYLQSHLEGGAGKSAVQSHPWLLSKTLSQKGSKPIILKSEKPKLLH